MPLFQLGRFMSASGLPLEWKIECDDLSPSDLDCLAFVGKELIGDFGPVVYVPEGAWHFAQAMRKWSSLSSARVLLVDDVLTTGASITRVRERLLRNQRDVVGLVIFARAMPPPWVHAIFTLAEGVK